MQIDNNFLVDTIIKILTKLKNYFNLIKIKKLSNKIELIIQKDFQSNKSKDSSVKILLYKFFFEKKLEDCLKAEKRKKYLKEKKQKKYLKEKKNKKRSK